MRNEWSPLRPPFGTRRTAGAACETNKGPARRRSSVSIERKFWMWRASLRAATRNTSGFEWEFRPAVAVSCVALHAFTAWNIYRSTSRQNGAPLASVALHIFPSISLFAPGAIFLLARGICIFASDVFHPECGWGLGTASLSIAGTCVNCCAGHRKKSCRTRPRGATKNWSDCFIYLVCCIRSWQSFQWEKEQTENICKKAPAFLSWGNSFWRTTTLQPSNQLIDNPDNRVGQLCLPVSSRKQFWFCSRFFLLASSFRHETAVSTKKFL